MQRKEPIALAAEFSGATWLRGRPHAKQPTVDGMVAKTF
jgi:hypothetical protein